MFADLDREREILAPLGVELAIVTPHTGFHSVEASAELQRRAAVQAARALRGEALECPVNSIPATVS